VSIPVHPISLGTLPLQDIVLRTGYPSQSVFVLYRQPQLRQNSTMATKDVSGSLSEASERTEKQGGTLDLTVFQDPTCPWCCVGIHELQSAIKTLEEQIPGLDVNVTFMPYVIDPSLPSTEDDVGQNVVSRVSTISSQARTAPMR
jgi:hypothetical protein